MLVPRVIFTYKFHCTVCACDPPSHQTTKYSAKTGFTVKGNPIEKTTLQKGHSYLATNSVYACDPPSHQTTKYSAIFAAF